MTKIHSSSEQYTLWGGALSLYSGKVRSYLIKKGIEYREYYSSHPDFQERIRPVVRLGVTPILETPDGVILQDSTAIIEFMEQAIPSPSMMPSGPVQQVIVRLIDAYATEHLLLPAMHYRWSEPYLQRQKAFLEAEFGRVSYLGVDRDKRNAAGSRMISYFSGMLPALGSTPETAPVIEAAYLELLELLDKHFQHVPYVMGGHPSVADFGLMAPLFAHLGRDPEPAHLMALRAPNVFRWVERMNLAVIEDAEFPNLTPTFPENDSWPSTLEPILELIFRDWGPELQANAVIYNKWVAANPEKSSGEAVNLDEKRRVHPSLGPIEYPWRSITMRRASAPHSLWHFGFAASAARSLTGGAATQFSDLLERTGGKSMMEIELARPLKRDDYLLALA